MLYIRRAFYSNPGPVQHMSINHRGSHIAMSKQFLYCTDVVSPFKEMGGKGVTEYMTAYLFMQTRLYRGFFHCVLQDAFVQVMTPYFPGPGVRRKPFRGKHILPAPFFGGLRILSRKGRPKIYLSEALRQVFVVLRLDCFKMLFELLLISFRKDLRGLCCLPFLHVWLSGKTLKKRLYLVAASTP